MSIKPHTLTEQLTKAVKKTPNNIALQIKKSNGYEKYTYQDLYNNAQSISQNLVNLGIKKNDRIAIILENEPKWSFIYFGILYAGAIAVPLDPQSTPENLKYFFKDSECKIAFTSTSFKKIVSLASEESQTLQNIILINSNPSPHELNEKIIHYSELKNTPSSDQIIIDNETNDIASIIYTSGTTDKPKGVMLTHNNFYSNFCSIEKLNIFKETHNFISILPLHHSFPFMVTLIIPLFTNNKITYVSSLKQEEIINCMQETNVTILAAVPQFFYLFHQAILNKIKKLNPLLRIPLLGLINGFNKIKSFSSINLNKILLSKIHRTFGKKLKYFVCGGAKLDEETELFFNKIGFTLIQGYGLTETSPIVSLNPIEKIKIGSAGKTIQNVKIKVIAPNKDGVGEIAIQGPNVMKGYYKKEQETSSLLHNNWLHTGDLGYLDQEGYLFLKGRKKELIILSSGKNISPEEVEKHYLQSPFIKEICVLLACKNNEEKLSAVIVPDFEYFKKTGESDIHNTIKIELDSLSKNYPIYKSIMGFIITKNDLSRTRLGKLQRHKIKNDYFDELVNKHYKKHPKENLDHEETKILSLPVYKNITDIISKIKSQDNHINLNDHLSIDLSLDSLSRIELFSTLEKHFAIIIPEHLMTKISSVKELVLTVNQLIEEQKPDSFQKVTYANENMWKEILNDKPNKEITDKIDLSPNWLAWLFYKTFCKVISAIFKAVWRLKAYDTKNLPKNKPFILCPNHTSYLDAFLILAAIPNHIRKNIFFMGFHTFFSAPIIRNIIKTCRIIPIDPAVNSIDAMQTCSHVLKNRKPLCIFPEGARSGNGKLQNFKKGIGILAKELDIPLLPVYIDGAFEALPRDRSIPRFNKVKIIFGKPIDPEILKIDGLDLNSKDDYEAIAKGIRAHVEKLQPKC